MYVLKNYHRDRQHSIYHNVLIVHDHIGRNLVFYFHLFPHRQLKALVPISGTNICDHLHIQLNKNSCYCTTSF